ncbi:hypothetical protein [Desulforamulus profundi]|uniref:hypothetical protein n=1 Tax=Desulforamulus profundi TaxID=1383067 RepID=UPI0011781969|nr:hypothetical protein [Desulforamulus profundi]
MAQEDTFWQQMQVFLTCLKYAPGLFFHILQRFYRRIISKNKKPLFILVSGLVIPRGNYFVFGHAKTPLAMVALVKFQFPEGIILFLD